VVVILNLGKKAVSFALNDGITEGTYTDLFSGEETKITQGLTIKLDAWGFKVLTK